MSEQQLNWQNYGDISITEGWTLVLKGAKSCYHILKTGFDHTTEKYTLEDTYVDTNNEWIEKYCVMDYIGMTDETYDEVLYAIGCLDYYGGINFGCYEPDTFESEEELAYYLRDKKGVDIERVGE